MARAPSDAEREPRRLHAGDVARQRRPPQGVAERGLGARACLSDASARAGMHEQRGAARLDALEHRAQLGDRLDARERAGRERDANAATCERTVDIVGVDTVQRDRPPHAERAAERERAVVVGIDQLERLLAWKPLDPERTRQAHERLVEPIELDELRAAGGLLALEVDHVWTLTDEIQDRQPILAANERQLAAISKRLHKRLGPKVLVYVDLHQISDQLYGD